MKKIKKVKRPLNNNVKLGEGIIIDRKKAVDDKALTILIKDEITRNNIEDNSDGHINVLKLRYYRNISDADSMINILKDVSGDPFALFDLITCYRYKLNKLDKINDEKEYNKLLKILMNSIKEFERIKIEELYPTKKIIDLFDDTVNLKDIVILRIVGKKLNQQGCHKYDRYIQKLNVIDGLVSIEKDSCKNDVDRIYEAISYFNDRQFQKALECFSNIKIKSLLKEIYLRRINIATTSGVDNYLDLDHMIKNKKYDLIISRAKELYSNDAIYVAKKLNILKLIKLDKINNAFNAIDELKRECPVDAENLSLLASVASGKSSFMSIKNKFDDIIPLLKYVIHPPGIITAIHNLINKKLKTSNNKDKIIAGLNEKIKIFENEKNSSGEKIKQLELTIKEKNDVINTVNNEIANKKKIIDDLRIVIDEKDNIISSHNEINKKELKKLEDEHVEKLKLQDLTFKNLSEEYSRSIDKKNKIIEKLHDDYKKELNLKNKIEKEMSSKDSLIKKLTNNLKAANMNVMAKYREMCELRKILEMKEETISMMIKSSLEKSFCL